MGENDVNMKSVSNRIRQYPDTHKGPYIVNIRAKESSLESKKIQKYIFENYQHVDKIEHVNEHKLRVTFCESAKQEKIVVNGEELISDKNARHEANELPHCASFNEKYRVYIPEKYVEIKGVISWPKDENIDDFSEIGEGKFNNSALKEVKVLEAVRLMRKSDEAASTPKLENTGLVIITFEGRALPNKFNLNGMLTHVREYRPKQMFCTNCQKYNHTHKMCNNKKVSPPPNIKCLQCQSNDHESGSVNCPRRKILQKKSLQHDRQVRKKTYAELLHELDPNHVMPNEPQSYQNFPPLVGTSRKREAEEKRKTRQLQQTYSPSESPQRKKVCTEAESTPPGFINPNLERSEMAEGIIDFVKSMVNDMGFSPFVHQILEKFVLPQVYKFIEKCTNSVMNKLDSTWQ